MAKVPLDSMTLNMLSDGYAGKVIDQAFAEVTKDIHERGHDGQKRKLIVEITFAPDGLGMVKVDTQAKTKLPAFRPPQTMAKLDQRAGGLVFNTDCAANPDQMTTNDLDGGE